MNALLKTSHLDSIVKCLAAKLNEKEGNAHLVIAKKNSIEIIEKNGLSLEEGCFLDNVIQKRVLYDDIKDIKLLRWKEIDLILIVLSSGYLSVLHYKCETNALQVVAKRFLSLPTSFVKSSELNCGSYITTNKSSTSITIASIHGKLWNFRFDQNCVIVDKGLSHNAIIYENSIGEDLKFKAGAFASVAKVGKNDSYYINLQNKEFESGLIEMSILNIYKIDYKEWTMTKVRSLKIVESIANDFVLMNFQSNEDEGIFDILLFQSSCIKLFKINIPEILANAYNKIECYALAKVSSDWGNILSFSILEDSKDCLHLIVGTIIGCFFRVNLNNLSANQIIISLIDNNDKQISAMSFQICTDNDLIITGGSCCDLIIYKISHSTNQMWFVDRILNMEPILYAKEILFNNVDTKLTCHGHGKKSGISFLHSGIKLDVKSELCSPDINQLFALKNGSLFVISFPFTTRIMQLKDEELNDVSEECCFDTNGSTLACGDGLKSSIIIIQVTRLSVISVSFDSLAWNRVDEWKQNDSTSIVAAAIRDGLIIVASINCIFILNANLAGEIETHQSINFDLEPSCVYLPPQLNSPPWLSNFVFIGTYKPSVLIINLNTWELVDRAVENHDKDDDSPPESLSFISSDVGQFGNLFIGLRNGVLIHATLHIVSSNGVDFNLNRDSISLWSCGNSPLRLIHLPDSSKLIVISNRSWLLEGFSPLNFDSFSFKAINTKDSMNFAASFCLEISPSSSKILYSTEQALCVGTLNIHGESCGTNCLFIDGTVYKADYFPQFNTIVCVVKDVSLNKWQLQIFNPDSGELVKSEELNCQKTENFYILEQFNSSASETFLCVGGGKVSLLMTSQSGFLSFFQILPNLEIINRGNIICSDVVACMKFISNDFFLMTEGSKIVLIKIGVLNNEAKTFSFTKVSEWQAKSIIICLDFQLDSNLIAIGVSNHGLALLGLSASEHLFFPLFQENNAFISSSVKILSSKEGVTTVAIGDKVGMLRVLEFKDNFFVNQSTFFLKDRIISIMETLDYFTPRRIHYSSPFVNGECRISVCVLSGKMYTLTLIRNIEDFKTLTELQQLLICMDKITPHFGSGFRSDLYSSQVDQDLIISFFREINIAEQENILKKKSTLFNNKNVIKRIREMIM